MVINDMDIDKRAIFLLRNPISLPFHLVKLVVCYPSAISPSGDKPGKIVWDEILNRLDVLSDSLS